MFTKKSIKCVAIYICIVYNDNKRKGVFIMSYQYYNPHPKQKKVGDCVKRAFTIATGKDYMEIQRELNALKNELGLDSFNNNKNFQEYIKRNGWLKLSFKAVKGEPRMNGHRFVKDYPKGTYVLRMAGHLATVKDGVLLDTWDSRKKCVYNAWKV